ncbi:bifunctional diguanylate cyclase/phosphodiesterase [Neorhizobium sp. P12A]|nr:bifunctional diguanylate cyclase/phosphodiesterase [Neorhizobium sp. P12A]
MTSLPKDRLTFPDLNLDFAGMLDLAPLPSIVVQRADNRVVYANTAFRRLLPNSASLGDARIDDFIQSDEIDALNGLLKAAAPTSTLLSIHLASSGQEAISAQLFLSRIGADAPDGKQYVLLQFLEVGDRPDRLAEIAEREARWNSALISSDLGVWDHDFKSGRMFYSDTWRKMRGLKTDEEFEAALGDWIQGVHPDDREHVLHAIERQNSGDPAYRIFEYRERHKDGHWVWIECRGASVEWDENGVPTHIIGTDTDISPRKAAEEMLAHVSRRLDLALEISRIGVFEADINKDEVEWDDRLLAIYGIDGTPNLKPSNFWEETLHPDDRERVLKRVNDNLMGDDGFLHEYRIVRPDGVVRVIRARAAPFVDERGNPKMIGANWDVTEEATLRNELHRAKTLAEARNGELEAAKEQIEHIAFHDHLTGLPNRRYLDHMLDRRSQECRADGSLLAILHIDLDRFKQINDTLGHRAGDMMLKHAAGILVSVAGKDDFVARIGGDEFVVVCKRKGFSKRIASMASQIIRELCKPVRYDGHDCRFGASIGIACDSGPRLDAHQLLLNADIALYRAKAGGRNRHEFFSHDMQRHIIATKQLSDEILRGLERHEFVPFYQPQFCARSLDVVGIETLARWQHPVFGLMTPDKFLSIAEDLDVVSTIDGLILEQALRDHAAWRDAGIDIAKISVNVSSRRLADPGLAKSLRALKIKPGILAFELLESISLDDCDEASTANLALLRRLGIDIEIDDFGTGHASIVSLLRLSPASLKIDRELIKPLPHSAEQRKLVGSIIDIGHSLNIRVTAEGVETPEHVHILGDLGCDQLQGFALAHPMKAADMPNFIRSESWRGNERGARATQKKLEQSLR